MKRKNIEKNACDKRNIMIMMMMMMMTMVVVVITINAEYEIWRLIN